MSIEVQKSQLEKWANKLCNLPYHQVYEVINEIVELVNSEQEDLLIEEQPDE